MRRTEWLQETRKMRFEEAYEGWQARRLTQEEAARLLGVCERTFRRYLDRYEEAGLEGLIDKRLEQVSQRRAPVVHAYMPLWLARVAENTLGHPLYRPDHLNMYPRDLTI